MGMHPNMVKTPTVRDLRGGGNQENVEYGEYTRPLDTKAHIMETQ